MMTTLQHLELLIGYLQVDPQNPDLLAEAAQVGMDVGRIDFAADCIARLGEQAPADLRTRALGGRLAMAQGRWADAACIHSELIDVVDTPAVRFNYAWSHAMAGQKAAALALLTDACVDRLPQAAMLRVQLLHDASEFDGAMAFALAMIATHGDDPGFAAAVAVLAIDMEDIDLARRCAARGGNHPDALASGGMLALRDGDPSGAAVSFTQSIETRSHNPRAWIGRGLARLAQHDAAAAAIDLDRGAEQFTDHIGSWIAAGWAHFAAGHSDTARNRFMRALALDENFAESHGSAAVLDILDGEIAAAKRRIVIALRLDRQCFSAILAQSLLMADRPDQAAALVTAALQSPLGGSGRTIAQQMALMRPGTVH
jgi:Tfp pilus assembly protein PilF